MPDVPFEKYSPGEKREGGFPAALYNELLDMVKWYRAQLATPPASSPIARPPTQTYIRVKNSSGSARGRFDVLGLSGPLMTYTTDTFGPVVEYIAATGVTPSASHSGRYCVLQEPLAANAIGMAIVRGLTPVKVERTTGIANDWADIVAGDATKLKVASTGSARIIGTPHATPSLCYVILGQPYQRPRYAKVTGAWRWSGFLDNAPWRIDANPCLDHTGLTPDTSTNLQIWIDAAEPNTGGVRFRRFHPNVQANDIIEYEEDCNGRLVCRSNVLDARVHSLAIAPKSHDGVTNIPRGWALCDGINNTIVTHKGTGLDLRGRVIRYVAAGTGGSDTITILDHTGVTTDVKLHDYTFQNGVGANLYIPSPANLGTGTGHDHTLPAIAHTGGSGRNLANTGQEYSIIPSYFGVALMERLNDGLAF